MRHAGPFATMVQSRWASYQNRRTDFRALGDICTAYLRGGSPCQFGCLKASELGQECLQSVKVWRGVVPFLQFPPAARRVCYTTNSIEPVNAQLREATRNRGKVLTDVAALKILWLMICNIEDNSAAQRAKKRSTTSNATAQLEE